MQPHPHFVHLAHGASGWWDEIALTVPVPVLFVVLLILGRRSRRVARELAAQQDAAAGRHLESAGPE